MDVAVDEADQAQGSVDDPDGYCRPEVVPVVVAFEDDCVAIIQWLVNVSGDR